jgi:tRNA nucleotidyltransferase (CCA-adding enzyme)
MPEVSPADLIGGLPPAIAHILGRACAIAVAQGARLWLVGGVVRDLLLGARLGPDVDLAVEGDVAALADALAAALSGIVLARHREFGTATLRLPCPDLTGAALDLDLACARVERYPQPAILPLVRPATISEDLRRRDFSVNAIAVELLVDDDQLRAGALLDPYDGRGDLAARQLRLLHPESLRDDPTRLLRGLRLAARLDLRPDEATAAQIAAALAQGYLGMLTPERILGELCLALEEPRPEAVLALADAWGVTPQVAPGLSWSEGIEARFARWGGVWNTNDAKGAKDANAKAFGARKTRRVAKDANTKGGEGREREGAKGGGGDDRAGLSAIGYRLSAVAAGLLCYDLAPADLDALAGRYPLPTPFARLLAEIPALRHLALRLRADLRPSQIDLLLRPHSEVAISVLQIAETGLAGQVAARYLREILPTRLPLDGRDLQRLGLAPGPVIGKMLAALRVAYLDGHIQTREQAEEWVREQTGADQRN